MKAEINKKRFRQLCEIGHAMSWMGGVCKSLPISDITNEWIQFTDCKFMVQNNKAHLPSLVPTRDIINWIILLIFLQD